MAAGDYDRVQMKDVITDGVSRVTTTVQDALQSGNYSNLSRNVSADLEHLFSNIGRTVNTPYPQNGRNAQTAQNIPGYRNLTNAANYRQTQTYRTVQDINQSRYQAAQGVPASVPAQNQGIYRHPELYKNLESSKVGAIVGTVIGYVIGGAVLGPVLLMFLGAILSGELLAGLLVTLFLGMIPAGALTGAVLGTFHLMKISRFEKYLKVLQDKTYAPVQKLSDATGRSAELTVKDLEEMIRKGWFLQGHLDEGKETLITSSETYEQYLVTVQAAAERALEEMAKAREYDGLTEAQQSIITQGEQYIREIRDCNLGIPDAGITAKLDRMVHSVEVIVGRAKQQPELTADMHRLMNYYLPTMVKLLHSYIDLDRQGKSSTNIEKSKREIEDTIDVMNEAFDRLFDSLFEDTSLDISTDVEVMRTLLSQEGLTGHSFTSNQVMPGTGNGES